MTEVYMEITGAVATARKVGPLTAGMVGVPVMFSFSPEWQELNLLAVFRAGEEKKDNEIKEGRSVIPAQVLTQPGQMLCIGVEGRSKDGALVIPTVWAEVGRILDGAQAANDPALAPTPTQFERFMAGLEQVDEKLQESLRQAKESGAFNGTSVTHRWEGTTLEVTSASGTSRADLKGDKGDPGIVNIQDGSTEGSLRTTGSKEESNTYTMGWFAFAEGNNTTATGGSSHAEGTSTTATGDSSHAEGASTTASGTASHAEGFNTNASGVRSHAEGTSTTATGDSSHAEGFLTTASGKNAHAEGNKTTASGANSHVQGKYNVDDPDGKYAHIVGNGEGSLALSNAHTIDWKGNAWFAGDVYVGGTGQDDPNAKKLGAGGGGGIDVTATPGQIIQVKTVDENGKPTEWEAVDMPSGGGVELDETLSDSTKAAPASILGEVKANAEAAAHAAVIAGEGALVMPYMETYAKLMAGEAIADQFIHVSDKVPTMADLEAGFAMMLQFPLEAELGLMGANAITVEILPKAMDEEVFAQAVMELGGVIMCGEGVLIVSDDNATLEDITFPKKGVYTVPGFCAFRINGYSFSEGAGSEEINSVTVSGNTISWNGDTTGLETTSVEYFAFYKVSNSAPTYEQLEKGFELYGVGTENGSPTSSTTVWTEEDIANYTYTPETPDPPLGWMVQDKAILVADGAVVIVLEDFADEEDGIYFTKGTYLSKVNFTSGDMSISATVRSLTTYGFSDWTAIGGGGSADVSNGVVYFDMTDTGEKDSGDHPIYSTSLSSTEIIDLYRGGAYVIGRLIVNGAVEGESNEYLFTVVAVLSDRVCVGSFVMGAYLIQGNTATWD